MTLRLTNDLLSSSSIRVSPAASSLSRRARTCLASVQEYPKWKNSSCGAPLPGCKARAKPSASRRIRVPSAIAAGLIGIEAEVALVEAARPHLVGDGDPEMSEAHGQQDR